MQSEKSKIENYIKLHAIESCLDVVINDVIEKRPANPFKAMAVLLETKSLSEILDIKLSYSICENGNIGVNCTIATNLGSYTSTIGIPYALQQQILSSDSSSILNMEAEEDKVNHLLKGQDPRNLKGIEAVILESYTTSDTATSKDKNSIVKLLKLVITMSCFRAAAGHNCEPLYKYIASYYETNSTISPSSDILKIPLPSVSIANGVPPNLTNVPFQSLNLLLKPKVPDNVMGNNDDLNNILNVEASLLYLKRILIKFQAKLDGEKGLSATTSKSGTYTCTVPAANLGGDKLDKKAAAAKDKKGAKGADVKADAVTAVIGPIQMSSVFPSWLKVFNFIILHFI